MPIAPTLLATYAALPDRFYAPMAAQPTKAPKLLHLNEPLAKELGLDVDWLRSEVGLAMLAGNAFPESAKPLAMVYAGHQFGHFSPRLGDGRALLIGEVETPDGTLRDLHLKGSGPTPFSRNGDGRAGIGPVLRECLISEAMHALGIPTTRSLAAVSTGQWIFREEAVPGAVLTRVARSHIRVGTFEYFASQGDDEALQILCRKVSHLQQRTGMIYPSTPQDDSAREVLERAVEQQAGLIARWMSVGFIHGVMNTDNMALSGETIDYGPCAFMDAYDPLRVFSSIDRHGRYAFGRQPSMAQWNLARFAEALLTLLDADQARAIEIATEIINRFPAYFEAAMTKLFRAKLGLQQERENDLALAQELLAIMAANKADFTLTFRSLGKAAEGGDQTFLTQFAVTGKAQEWLARWRERLSVEQRPTAEIRAAMDRVNPVVIPRNHLVEEALAGATSETADLTKFDALLDAVRDPFNATREDSIFAKPPTSEDPGYRTFCGT
jgi:serine/tyrosine/threonine adenylyltransferase